MCGRSPTLRVEQIPGWQQYDVPSTPVTLCLSRQKAKKLRQSFLRNRRESHHPWSPSNNNASINLGTPQEKKKRWAYCLMRQFWFHPQLPTSRDGKSSIGLTPKLQIMSHDSFQRNGFFLKETTLLNYFWGSSQHYRVDGVDVAQETERS